MSDGYGQVYVSFAHCLLYLFTVLPQWLAEPSPYCVETQKARCLIIGSIYSTVKFLKFRTPENLL